MKLKAAHILPYVVIALLLGYIFSLDTEVEYITLPPKVNTKVITSPQPISRGQKTIMIGGELRTVEVPNPVNDSLMVAYEQAIDSLERVQLYKDAITERKYVETLEDSVQTITVESNVIGTLTEQKISYRTHPITIERSSKRGRPEFLVGGFTALPTTLNNPRVVFGANASLKLKKTMYTVGYDTKGRVHAGVSIKIF